LTIDGAAPSKPITRWENKESRLSMTKLTPAAKKKLRARSRLAHLGRDVETSYGFVNIPPFRGSTVLYPDTATLKTQSQRYTYGRRGTPTTHALCEAWSGISGAAGTALVSSGLSAIVVALTTVVGAGDHLLVTDAVYRPGRVYCDTILKRMGVETTYYDPAIGAGVANLLRENTRAVYVEAPGSESLEMQDVPAIAEAAKARGVCVIMDNTWATPLFFSPYEHGVDLALESGTKYLSGHSDLLLGLVSASEEWFPQLHRTAGTLGVQPGAEEVYLALRGFRTMELRLREAERQGLALAHWLKGRPEVLRVLHPAMDDYPGRAIWKRDFSGSSGLFSIVLKPVPDQAVAALLDGLQLFGMGYSWGGFESLVIPFDCTKYRTATRWAPGGPCLRFSVGLEDIEDLKEDLERGFARLAAATA
jgi:cysteine-S-conjugate beta-lyase